METTGEIKAIRRAQKPALNAVLNIVFPASPKALSQYWRKVTFIDEPCCHLCGRPFPFDQGAGALCARCTARPPAYDMGRSALQYDADSRPLILAFKHGGRTVQLDRFAKQMSRAGRRFKDADYILPVPLHPKRLARRSYNQAALLAKASAVYLAGDYAPDVLFRKKDTPSQGAQSGRGRYRNVQGAFEVSVSGREKIKGKNLILIDDVLTTGATAESCARTLKRAGAQKVWVLSLARVVRDEEIPT